MIVDSKDIGSGVSYFKDVNTQTVDYNSFEHALRAFVTEKNGFLVQKVGTNIS
jgi:hypothetical protein